MYKCSQGIAPLPPAIWVLGRGWHLSVPSHFPPYNPRFLANFGDWILTKAKANYRLKADESAAVLSTNTHAFVPCLDCEVAHQLLSVCGS